MPQSFAIREQRTLSVLEVEMTKAEKAALAQLYQTPSLYSPLLDLLERACIGLDSDLIKADVGEPEKVLGAHARSQAGWAIFTWVQKQVQNAHMEITAIVPDEPEPSEEEQIQSPYGGMPGADVDSD